MRSFCWPILSLVLCCLALGCEKTGPNTEQPPPENGAECSSSRECLKKRCPQPDVDDYNKCVKARYNSQEASPEYVECNAGKCEDLAATSMGDGQVTVTFPEETKAVAAKDAVKWLRLYIYSNKDLDGKDITCARLKSMADSDPASLNSLDLNRYYPPPDFDKPITTDVIRSGDSLDLAFLHTHATVPAGDNRVFVIQGFCNPTEGRPTLETKHKWWACKESVSTKAGKEANNIPIELPVQNNDTCP